ncbi:hypothetical protein N9242_00030 [Vicingaceae bacterium]|nr:hypothetical protein [Vicingaceae bacterium]
MKRHIIVLTSFFITSLFSYGQSYFGFGGGIYQPSSYKVTKKHYYDNSRSSLTDENSFMFFIDYKERFNKTLNLGFSLSYKNQNIGYILNNEDRIKTGPGPGGYSSSYPQTNSNYINHYLNFAINTEIKPLKKIPIYINSGLAIDLLTYSVKDEKTRTLFYDNSIYESEDKSVKNTDATSVKALIYTGISVEIFKRIYLRSQIGYNLSHTYYGVKHLDLTFGIGYQFLLKNVGITKFFQNYLSEKGKPYVLKPK